MIFFLLYWITVELKFLLQKPTTKINVLVRRGRINQIWVRKNNPRGNIVRKITIADSHIYHLSNIQSGTWTIYWFGTWLCSDTWPNACIYCFQTRAIISTRGLNQRHVQQIHGVKSVAKVTTYLLSLVYPLVYMKYGYFVALSFLLSTISDLRCGEFSFPRITERIKSIVALTRRRSRAVTLIWSHRSVYFGKSYSPVRCRLSSPSKKSTSCFCTLSNLFLWMSTYGDQMQDENSRMDRTSAWYRILIVSLLKNCDCHLTNFKMEIARFNVRSKC